MWCPEKLILNSPDNLGYLHNYNTSKNAVASEEYRLSYWYGHYFILWERKLNHYHVHWLSFNLAPPHHYTSVSSSHLYFLFRINSSVQNFIFKGLSSYQNGNHGFPKKIQAVQWKHWYWKSGKKITRISLCVKRIRQQLLKQISDLHYVLLTDLLMIFKIFGNMRTTNL